MEDGTTYIDQEFVDHLQISPQYLEQEKLHQIEEIKRRASLFLGGGEYDLNDKTVILLDDGAATGATIIVAARSIRKRFRPKRLIIGLPVAPKDTVKLLKKEADLGRKSRYVLIPQSLNVLIAIRGSIRTMEKKSDVS